MTADASAAADVFITIRDSIGNPLSGKTVTVAPAVADVHVAATPISPDGVSAPGVSGAQGLVEFQVRDDVAETVTLVAMDETDDITLAPTTPPTVTFTAGPVDTGQSSVVATPAVVAPDGVSTSTISVTLVDHFDNPVSGKAVQLLQGSGHSDISPLSSTTSNAGVVTFTATDATPEAVTYAALDVSDGDLGVAQQATVTFEAATEAGRTTISVNQPSVRADGVSPAIVEVTLRDGQGNPLAGRALTLTTSPSGSAEVIPVQSGGAIPAGTTDAEGHATFWVLDTKVESVRISATDTSSSTGVGTPITVSFTAGIPLPSLSQVSANPSSVPADGTTSSSVTVTLRDAYGNLVAGKNVALSVGGGSSNISPSGAVTNQLGQASFAVSDASPGYDTFTADDLTDGLTVGTVTVTFGIPPPTAANSTFFAMPSVVPNDGTTAATITVFLRDADRKGVAGRTVILHSNPGHAVLDHPSATTDANGEATFRATDTTAESLSFTATDATDELQLPTSVLITFQSTSGQPPPTAVTWAADGSNGPFSSGQLISIDVASNSNLPSGTGLYIEECSAPNGVLPTSSAQCDAKTAQTQELFANSDGSASYSDYPVYALPDLASLNESSSGPSCSLSSECVFFVGENPTNFSLPHLFSAPFVVNGGDGTDSGANPGNGLPEAPYIVLFPLLAGLLLGGAAIARRRRRAQAP